MKIRSITCFVDPRNDPEGRLVSHLAEFCNEAIQKLSICSVEVESTRLSSPPFTQITAAGDFRSSLNFALIFQAQATENGFAYASCGPTLPEDQMDGENLAALLREAGDCFFGTVIADRRFIYPAAIKTAARTIKEASTITPDGFANLRFAALANTAAYGPFFPGSYGVLNEKPAFSLAIECADAFLAAFQTDAPLAQQRRSLVSTLEDFAATLSNTLDPLAERYSLDFKGFDFSPAPYPEPGCSLGGAIEALGTGLGKFGAVAGAAVIASTFQQGKWRHTGYNGLMLPVMEDALLAQRAAEGQLTIQDLLLYSSVCGTGLDTVPLPGDISTAELESILWDVAALAVRLGKPLTARLMPIPGKHAGEATAFDFGYFQNSRIMAIKGQQVMAPLQSDEPVALLSRMPNSHHPAVPD